MTASPAQLALLEGNQLRAEGRRSEALTAFTRAVELDPGYYDARINLASVLRESGALQDAFAQLEQATGIAPERHEAWFNLGNMARDNAQPEVAADFFSAAAQRMPDDPAQQEALGIAWLNIEQPGQAAICLRAAIATHPRHASLHAWLGVALRRLDDAPGAVEALAEAVRLAPDDARIRIEYGNALKQIGDYEQASIEYERILARLPDDAATRYSRALGLLACGRLAEGWDEYRYGWTAGKRQPRRPFPHPPWQGETDADVLLWGEQGVGDEILFSNMVRDAMTHLGTNGHTITVECDVRLVSLFARSFPAATVVARTVPPDSRTLAPGIGYQAPFGDLPARFRRQIGDFDGAAHLSADPATTERWRARLRALGPHRTVGISWRSRLAAGLRSASYMAIEDLIPVLRLPNLCFVVLQYDECRAEIETMKSLGFNLHRFDDLDLMNDLDGVAALMSALDAVIAPDNAVCALAGALGARTWRFQAPQRDYLQLGTDRLPWFSSVTILRRHADQSWSTVSQQLAQELTEFSRAGRPDINGVTP